jgi:hypothetical protein
MMNLHGSPGRIGVAAIVCAAVACVSVKKPVPNAGASVPGAILWAEPTDLAKRDLYNGPWGPEHAPDPGAVYTLVERKHTGVSLGMTVVDARGREWSVKQPYPGNLDAESPVEVTLSRILSAVGYPQPPVYYLPAFTLKDDWGTHAEVGGRFRLKLEELDDVGAWRWEENPFVGSPPYQGLIVLLMMFNATDLKNSNNTLYERRRGKAIERWHVVRDLGAALGDTHLIAPRKNHPASFEREPFVLGVTNGHVDFAYRGWYRSLVRDRITPNDVAWASNLVGRLTEQQWKDAFRAGGYEPAVADRFIKKLQEKIDRGRSIASRPQ